MYVYSSLIQWTGMTSQATETELLDTGLFPLLKAKYYIIKLPKIGNNLQQTEMHKNKQSKAEKDKQNKNKAKFKSTNRRRINQNKNK